MWVVQREGCRLGWYTANLWFSMLMGMESQLLVWVAEVSAMLICCFQKVGGCCLNQFRACLCSLGYWYAQFDFLSNGNPILIWLQSIGPAICLFVLLDWRGDLLQWYFGDSSGMEPHLTLLLILWWFLMEHLMVGACSRVPVLLLLASFVDPFWVPCDWDGYDWSWELWDHSPLLLICRWGGSFFWWGLDCNGLSSNENNGLSFTEIQLLLKEIEWCGVWMRSLWISPCFWFWRDFCNLSLFIDLTQDPHYLAIVSKVSIVHKSKGRPLMEIHPRNHEKLVPIALTILWYLCK